MGAVRGIVLALIGRPETLPESLLTRWPELREVRWRRGGLPPRIGGWGLGRRSVAAITLWRTVWLAPGARLDPALLLHERRHVTHFSSSPWFPLLYIFESVTRGYSRNRFERDADDWALARLRAPASQPLQPDA